MANEAQTKNRCTVAICLALALITFVLYWPVRHNGFTNFDDNGYITDNPHVYTGLNLSNVVWAFTHIHAGYWIPITWMSHMLDCQMFGLDAGPSHIVSVLIHIATTILIFLWLLQLTGAVWRCAFVAALFAWHPLHVESVAWACERKDVLSAFFWMLTLIAYTQYARALASSNIARATLHYGLALIWFACGMMSKPMVVTLPCVLLLLDFWPLDRFAPWGPKFNIQNIAKLVLEKIPFFAISAIGSIIGFWTQKSAGAVSPDTLSSRVANALGSYIRYISKFFWPSDLSVFYPFPEHGVIAMAIAGAILLLACSIAFIVLSRQWPYLFVGWFWYLGTFVPVIGLIQSGSQSMADRFIYIPGIGLSIVITWGIADFCASRQWKRFPAVASIVSLAACIAITSIQIKYWRSSITLFRHALDVTTDNYVADACLGQALDVEGRDREALKYCQDAVRINPDYPPGQFFLGVVLWKDGDINGAFKRLNAAALAAPRDSGFLYNLGKFLLEHGYPDKAAVRFQAAVDDPDFSELPEAHNALGKAFLEQGKLQQATDQLSRAVQLEPSNPQFHYDLGTVLLTDSRPNDAINEFSKAIALKPDFVSAQQNLAIALAGQNRFPEAIAHFTKVEQLQPNDPDSYFNLGLTFLKKHQPANAATQFSCELELSPAETKGHYRLAQALAQQNNFSQAVSEYRKTLQLTPNFPDAKKELDQILAAHPELR